MALTRSSNALEVSNTLTSFLAVPGYLAALTLQSVSLRQAMEPVILTEHLVPAFMAVSGLQSFQSFMTVLLPACNKSQSPSPVPSGT